MTWDGGEPFLGPIYSKKMVDVFGPARAPRTEPQPRHADLAASVQLVLEECYFALLNAVLRPNRAEKGLPGRRRRAELRRQRDDLRAHAVRRRLHPAGRARRRHLNRRRPSRLARGSRPASRLRQCATSTTARSTATPRSSASCATRGLESDTTRRGAADRPHRPGVGGRADRRVVPGTHGVRPARARRAQHPRRPAPQGHEGHPERTHQAPRDRSGRSARPSWRKRPANYFETSYPSPFMVQAYKINAHQRGRIPAVTHEDGTGRLQTVERDVNPLYWSLLKRFGELTGVPILLNTSFNENEPIVNTPAQAIDCFLRTKMDVPGDRRRSSCARSTDGAEAGIRGSLRPGHLKIEPTRENSPSQPDLLPRRRVHRAARQRSGPAPGGARPRRHCCLQPPRVRQPATAVCPPGDLAGVDVRRIAALGLRQEGAVARAWPTSAAIC